MFGETYNIPFIYVANEFNSEKRRMDKIRIISHSFILKNKNWYCGRNDNFRTKQPWQT